MDNSSGPPSIVPASDVTTVSPKGPFVQKSLRELKRLLDMKQQSKAQDDGPVPLNGKVAKYV